MSADVASTKSILDFDTFYTEHFSDVVAMVFAYTSDLGAAQDIAQEAFYRAWRHWKKIGNYDSPQAWVKRVATNMAHSRWRRLKIAAGHLIGQRVEHSPPMNPDHVAVVAALRKLPQAQREALVLHHMMDVPVIDLAERFAVPVNTVKSWLHRGRAAMAEDLGTDVRSRIITPPPDTITSRPPRTSRAAVAAATVVLVVVGGYIGVQLGRSNRQVPPTDKPTPSPTSSPTPAPSVSPTSSPTPPPTQSTGPTDPIATVDWRKATITLDLPSQTCPKGKAVFAPESGSGNAVATVGGVTVRIKVGNDAQIGYGDLNGDGTAEAVFGMICTPASGSPVEELVAIERRAGGSLTATAMSSGSQKQSTRVFVRSGRVYQHSFWNEAGASELGNLFMWKWESKSLTAIPYYANMRSLDFTEVAPRMNCGGATWSFGNNFLRFTGAGDFGAGGDTLRIFVNDQPIFEDRGRRWQPYLVLNIGCRRAGGSEFFMNRVVFDLAGLEQWRAVELVAS